MMSPRTGSSRNDRPALFQFSRTSDYKDATNVDEKCATSEDEVDDGVNDGDQ